MIQGTLVEYKIVGQGGEDEVYKNAEKPAPNNIELVNLTFIEEKPNWFSRVRDSEEADPLCHTM